MAKIRRNANVDKKVFDMVIKFCKENNYSKSDFIGKVIKDNVDEMNCMDVSVRSSFGNEKGKLQFLIEEDDYNKINKPIVTRIEKILEKVISEIINKK